MSLIILNYPYNLCVTLIDANVDYMQWYFASIEYTLRTLVGRPIGRQFMVNVFDIHWLIQLCMDCGLFNYLNVSYMSFNYCPLAFDWGWVRSKSSDIPRDCGGWIMPPFCKMHSFLKYTKSNRNCGVFGVV